jgi:maleylacetate reductase
MADPLEYDATPRVVFGPGAIGAVPEEVRRLGAGSVLLVADPYVPDVADRLAAALGGAVADRVDEVVMHVPVAAAEAASERATRHRVDLVVSVGGGSATGLAKAVALRTHLPILAVPTTYAGSEMTPVWGLTEQVDGVGRKRTGRDPVVRPRVVVYDPELTVSLPPDLSATSGMNALAHLVGGVFGPAATPIAGTLAEEGIRTMFSALPRVVAEPADLDARADALRGAWLAGWVLGTTPMGLHHRICHVLGGAYNLPHSPMHAALLPYTTAAAAATAGAAPERAARAFGGTDPATALFDLARVIGAPTSLRAVGFDPRHVDEVAETVAAAPDTYARSLDARAVRDLLRAACNGGRPGSRR